MLHRQSPAAVRKAANDNFIIPNFAAMRSAPGVPQAPALLIGREPAVAHVPFRIGFRPLLVIAFALLILFALSSAFLLGLAAVGVLAMAIAGFQLLRRQVAGPAKPVLGAFDRRAIGY